MKKFLAILLAMMLVLSMSAMALADDEPTDMESVTIIKVYKLVGAGSNPAETFSLVQTGSKVVNGEATSAPALKKVPETDYVAQARFDEGAASAEGAKAEFVIYLPDYTNVGIYEYTLREAAGTTAGVSYYGSDILLRVTVINDENGKIRVAAVHTESTTEEGAQKSNSFTNTYSAGTLKVTKTVEGNLGDTTKYFAFKISLTGEEGKTYADSYEISGGSSEDNPSTIEIGTTATVYLKHGDTISIANLPYGVTYTVEEVSYEADGYTTTKVGDSGTINSAEATAAFKNVKDNGNIDTGITTDSLPYILLMGLVVLAGVAMIMKRRMADND